MSPVAYTSFMKAKAEINCNFCKKKVCSAENYPTILPSKPLQKFLNATRKQGQKTSQKAEVALFFNTNLRISWGIDTESPLYKHFSMMN